MRGKEVQPFPSQYSPFLHFFICQPSNDSLPSPSFPFPIYSTFLFTFPFPFCSSLYSSFPLHLPLSLPSFLFPYHPSPFPTILPRTYFSSSLPNHFPPFPLPTFPPYQPFPFFRCYPSPFPFISPLPFSPFFFPPFFSLFLPFSLPFALPFFLPFPSSWVFDFFPPRIIYTPVYLLNSDYLKDLINLNNIETFIKELKLSN